MGPPDGSSVYAGAMLWPTTTCADGSRGYAATGRAALEHVAAGLVQHGSTLLCVVLQSFRDIVPWIFNAHCARSSDIAYQLDERARHPHADANFGANWHDANVARQHLGDVIIAFVATVVANGLSNQTTADRDTQRRR